MASFKDIDAIAHSSAFRGRCLYALQVAAINIMAENPATASHTDRATYARKVIEASVNSYSVSLAVLTNSTIAAEANFAAIDTDCGVSDGDIQFTINSIFNALAGIST